MTRPNELLSRLNDRDAECSSHRDIGTKQSRRGEREEAGRWGRGWKEDRRDQDLILKIFLGPDFRDGQHRRKSRQADNGARPSAIPDADTDRFEFPRQR